MQATKSFRKITFQLISICVLLAFTLPAASTQANGFEPIGYWSDPVHHSELNGKVWSQPTLLSELNGPEGNIANSPCLSGDGLRMYFSREIPALGHRCIVEAVRPIPTGPFTSERILTEIVATGYHIGKPWISADQLRLYYHEGGDLNTIKMAQRGAIGDTWTPTKTFDELNAGGWNATGCSLTADELTIVLQSNRPGSMGPSNLWMAIRPSTDDPFTGLTPLDTINSTSYDGSPYITPDGLTLYFGSSRISPDSDIYKATRASSTDPFGNLEFMSISTDTDNEQNPHVTADQKTIYFNKGAPYGPGDGIWVSHWIGSSYDVALSSIRAAMADKTAAIDKITDATNKELTAIEALNELLQIDEPSELTDKAISRAKMRLLSSIRRQIKARIELRRGLRELELALDILQIHLPRTMRRRPVGDSSPGQ